MQESPGNVPTRHLRMRSPHYSWFQTICRHIYSRISCNQRIWDDRGLHRQAKRCSQREKGKNGLLWSLSLSITIQWERVHLLRWTNHSFKWMRTIFFQLEKNIGLMCDPSTTDPWLQKSFSSDDWSIQRPKIILFWISVLISDHA